MPHSLTPDPRIAITQADIISRLPYYSCALGGSTGTARYRALLHGGETTSQTVSSPIEMFGMAQQYSPEEAARTELAISRAATSNGRGMMLSLAGGFSAMLEMDPQSRLAAMRKAFPGLAGNQQQRQGGCSEEEVADLQCAVLTAHRILLELSNRRSEMMALDPENQVVAMRKVYPRLHEKLDALYEPAALFTATHCSSGRLAHTACCQQQHPQSEGSASAVCMAAGAVAALGSGNAARDGNVREASADASACSSDARSDDNDDDDGLEFHYPSAVPAAVVVAQHSGALGPAARTVTTTVPRVPASLGTSSRSSLQSTAGDRTARSGSRRAEGEKCHDLPHVLAAAAASQCKPLLSGQISGGCGGQALVRTQRQVEQPRRQTARRPQQSHPQEQQPKQRLQIPQRPHSQPAQQQVVQPKVRQAQASKEALPVTVSRPQALIAVPQPQRPLHQAPKPQVQPQAQRQQQPLKALPSQFKAPQRAQPQTKTSQLQQSSKPQQLKTQPPAQRAGAASATAQSSSSCPSYMRSTTASCAKALKREAAQPGGATAAAAQAKKICKARRT